MMSDRSDPKYTEPNWFLGFAIAFAVMALMIYFNI